ncbi:MAG: C25 family peptidase propeptide domain-containing protein, partial [Candidatus Thorarchaeota archaeon]
MIKVNQISKRKSLKLTAFLITVTIIISSTPAFVIVTIPETTPTAYLIPHTENTPDSNDIFQRTPQEHSFLTSDWNNMSSDTSPGSPPEVNVTVDSLGIAIEFDIKGFWEGNITLDGIDYDTITIPGAFSKTVPGDPAIPRISMYLEVPHEIDIAVDVTHVDSTVLGGYKIYPYQIPAISLPNITRNPVVFNSATNTTNAFYPYVNATINGGLETSSIIMRGRRLVVLSVYPIQFNPVTGQLRTYSHMEIQLTYSEEADIQPVDASLYSATFENLFQSLTLNFVPMDPPQFNTTPSFSVLPSGNLLAQSSTPGAEYLIIVYDEFYSAALDLAEWKTRKGVPTEVIGTSQIFGDTDLVNELVSASQTSLNPKINTLKQYLQNIYQTWSPVPTYVLFLGDSEHIPCDYSIEHTGELSDETRVHGDSSVNKIATDVPYFCIQSESYFPD